VMKKIIEIIIDMVIRDSRSNKSDKEMTMQTRDRIIGEVETIIGKMMKNTLRINKTTETVETEVEDRMVEEEKNKIQPFKTKKTKTNMVICKIIKINNRTIDTMKTTKQDLRKKPDLVDTESLLKTKTTESKTNITFRMITVQNWIKSPSTIHKMVIHRSLTSERKNKNLM